MYKQWLYHKSRRCLLLGRKAMTNLDSIVQSRDITLPTKVHIVKAMVFPVVTYVWMWELDHKTGWGQKKGLFQVVVLGKTLESPLDCKEIKPVNPKGNQSWIFIGRTNGEAPIIWPPDAKSWLIRKDSDVGKELGQEEKRATEDEMFGWHHRLKGHEFEWILGDSEGQGSLVCCKEWSQWVRQDLLMEQQQILWLPFLYQKGHWLAIISGSTNNQLCDLEQDSWSILILNFVLCKNGVIVPNWCQWELNKHQYNTLCFILSATHKNSWLTLYY